MTKDVLIKNPHRKNWIPIEASLCNSFFSRFRGLMFTSAIAPYEGLVFANSHASIVDSSIHMLFMWFDITVVWLSNDYRVIEKTIAHKWHLLYIPKSPAAYILELHPNRYHDFDVEEVLELQYV